MVSIKVPHAHINYHLVPLVLLSVIVAETRRYRDSGIIVYPDDDILEKSHLDIVKTKSMDLQVGLKYDIPSALIEAMNNIDDPELFENYFIEDDLRILDDGVNLQARSGAEVVENNGNFVKRPLQPLCEPRPTLVPLRAPQWGLIMQPPCLEVPRCAGCCAFGWKCTPVSYEIFTYSVKLAKYIPNTDRFTVKGRFNVTEEHHRTCKCRCDVNSEECHRRGRVYESNECKCVCRNQSQNSFQCSQRGRTWNSDTCTCDCAVVTCEEGSFFDEKTCKCDF